MHQEKITIALPAFGALIPGQGGHFVGILRGPVKDGIEVPPFAVLVSPADQGEFERVAWGDYVELKGCDSRQDGQANTAAMVDAGCAAVQPLVGLVIDGVSGWHLPSINELRLAYANAPELFKTEGWYWSSTQSSRTSAFVQDFENGSSIWGFKVNECRVRAFRAIPLDALTA